MFTIAGWVGFAFIVAAAFGLAWWLVAEEETPKGITFGIATAVVIGSFCALFFYYTQTATGQRALKSQESELNNGVERIVTVYDVEGEIIAQYDGKFDITYDDDRILFDDENGKRHIIYYSISTVTIDEK